MEDTRLLSCLDKEVLPFMVVEKNAIDMSIATMARSGGEN